MHTLAGLLRSLAVRTKNSTETTYKLSGITLYSGAVEGSGWGGIVTTLHHDTFIAYALLWMIMEIINSARSNDGLIQKIIRWIRRNK